MRQPAFGYDLRRMLALMRRVRARPFSLQTAPSAAATAGGVTTQCIGTRQKLFLFDGSAPGQAFLLPHGTRIFNRLLEMMRSLYREHDYDEIVTPMMFRQELWRTSGHHDHYENEMFGIRRRAAPGDEEDEGAWGLKPMNCPAHCLVFASQQPWSYRRLPVRYADFSPLHRDEASGALSGLTRLRRFHQDDAHIFCRPDQVQDEISACLQMLDQVYSAFGFSYELALSTRPASSAGDDAVWDASESALETALRSSGRAFVANPGDGAFYGPKIDCRIQDSFGRRHQCGTIQLDMNLPARFHLQFTDQDGAGQRPILVHRAILGSLERMISMLVQHYAGYWPMWLSPRQVCVLPVSSRFAPYADHVLRRCRLAGLYADVDAADATLGRRLRNAAQVQYNRIVVVGESESRDQTVTVRDRDVDGAPATMPLDEFIDQSTSAATARQ